MVLSSVIALLSATLYGVSDFFGGVASLRLRVLPTTTTIYLCAALVLAIALPFTAATWSVAAVLWGSAAGVFATVGFLTFYAAMAAGPISLVSPLIAVLESVVPVGVAVTLGEVLTPSGWLGIALAVLSGILISVQRTKSHSHVTVRTVVLSSIAGLTLGLAIVALDRAPHSSRLVPGLLEIAVGIVLLAALSLAVRGSERTRTFVSVLDHHDNTAGLPSRGRAMLLAVLGGLLLGGANAGLIFALQSGSLAIVAVLVGLYPLPTILVARLVIKERMTRTQLIGIALAVIASALLALN
ncbi:MAG TPA: EamA family transporter [Microbacteriaceae bacterium]